MRGTRHRKGKPGGQKKPLMMRGFLPRPHLAREFLAQCHAEAHYRSVKAEQQPPVPCLHCGRDYPWHVREGVYWQVA